MEMIRGYFSKRWLFGPLQTSHHVKTHTHSMGLVSFRRNFLPAHRPVWFQRSFEALALSTLNDSIGNFLLFFFTEGHLDWHFSVKCLSHADSPTQLVLVLSTGSFKIEIVRGRLQQKGNRVTYYLRRRHPHSHRKITWNTVITVYWLCSCVSMLFLLVPAISQKISAIPFHTLFYYSPSPCVSSPAFPL